MTDRWLLWPLLSLAAVFGIYRMTRTPRGIRNNNPGNVRDTGTDWLGRSGTDGEFVVFSDPVYGVRAMARVLKNYRDRYGLDTVEEIISRWAPPTENNTQAYIDAVSRALAVAPDDPLDLDRVLPELVAAIIRHENGIQPYDVATIERGVALA